MTRLISQYEASYGVSEDEEADRLYYAYGWARACVLVQVFERTSQRVYRAFWFRVGVLLSEKPDLAGPLPKEREMVAITDTGPKSVTVDGIKITREAFLRWLNSKGSVLRS